MQQQAMLAKGAARRLLKDGSSFETGDGRVLHTHSLVEHAQAALKDGSSFESDDEGVLHNHARVEAMVAQQDALSLIEALQTPAVA